MALIELVIMHITYHNENWDVLFSSIKGETRLAMTFSSNKQGAIKLLGQWEMMLVPVLVGYHFFQVSDGEGIL